jgi:two-component system catabolic regulation response regulator CreB/two-component system response regulator ChvI
MISLPQRHPSAEESLAVAKKGRILIVDDDPDITRSFGLAIEDSGLFEKVELCNDPMLALSNFRPDMYDIALLDVKMPDLNGFELYDKIKKIDYKVRVCFITGHHIDYSALKEEFPLLEVEFLIPKSVAISDLIKRLETELLR